MREKKESLFYTIKQYWHDLHDSKISTKVKLLIVLSLSSLTISVGCLIATFIYWTNDSMFNKWWICGFLFAIVAWLFKKEITRAKLK